MPFIEVYNLLVLAVTEHSRLAKTEVFKEAFYFYFHC